MGDHVGIRSDMVSGACARAAESTRLTHSNAVKRTYLVDDKRGFQ